MNFWNPRTFKPGYCIVEVKNCGGYARPQSGVPRVWTNRPNQMPCLMQYIPTTLPNLFLRLLYNLNISPQFLKMSVNSKPGGAMCNQLPILAHFIRYHCREKSCLLCCIVPASVDNSSRDSSNVFWVTDNKRSCCECQQTSMRVSSSGAQAALLTKQRKTCSDAHTN